MSKKINSKKIKKTSRKVQSEDEKIRKPKKISKKPKKIIEEVEEFEVSEELDPIDIEELMEKDNIEREIKGEVKENKIDIDKIDHGINKNLEKEAKENPQKDIDKTIKKPRKQVLIDKIIDLYKECDIPELDQLTPAALKSTKLNILERKIDDLNKKLAEKANKISKEIVSISAGSNTCGISDDSAADALYNVNLIMTQFIENCAIIGREHEVTKDYVPNLDGLTKRIQQEEKKKQLKETLKRIIERYGQNIKPYLNPLCDYAMIMISCAVEQISINNVKVIEDDIEKKN